MKVPASPEESPSPLAAAQPLATGETPSAPAPPSVKAIYSLCQEGDPQGWHLQEVEQPPEEGKWVVRYEDGSWGYQESDLDPFRDALISWRDPSSGQPAVSLDVTSYALPEEAFHPWREEEQEKVRDRLPSRRGVEPVIQQTSVKPPTRKKRKDPDQDLEQEEEKKTTEAQKGGSLCEELLSTAVRNRDINQRQMFESAREKGQVWKERLEDELYGSTVHEQEERSMTVRGLEEQSKPLSQQDYAGSPAPDLTAKGFHHLNTAG